MIKGPNHGSIIAIIARERRALLDMRNDKALTAQEVADILKIAKNTVYELVKRGELNSYKIGRGLRFSLEDVESYISNSKSIGSVPSKSSLSTNTSKSAKINRDTFQYESPSYGEGFVICGQDLMLDVLSNYIENHQNGVPTLRAYIGSYSSLVSLYYGKVQIASSHLWDGDTDTYNVPFVRRLLPGIPAVVVHLTKRTQGFYVQKGNPKNIRSWDDLSRSGIRIINREKGAGSRVLLDENIRKLGIRGGSIDGYYKETHSHVTVASTVARGDADLAIGDMKASAQFENLDFIPLKKESYDLVIKRDDFETPTVSAVMEILNSAEFRSEFEGIKGYDIADMGQIVAET